jgi:hypothetical protein
VRLEQAVTAPRYPFEVWIFACTLTDRVLAHLAGDMPPNGGIEVLGAFGTHSSDHILSGKRSVGLLLAQLAGNSKNLVTARHLFILPQTVGQ